MTQFDMFRKQRVVKSFQRKKCSKVFSAKKLKYSELLMHCGLHNVECKQHEVESWRNRSVGEAMQCYCGCNTIVGAKLYIAGAMMMIMWVQNFCGCNTVLGAILLWV